MKRTLNKLGVQNSLWNNIRASKGSGKAPTKEMLKQERKIKAEEKAMGGYVYAEGGINNPGFNALPEEAQQNILNNMAMGGYMYPMGGRLMNTPMFADGGKLPKNVLQSRLEAHMSPEETNEYLSEYGKGGYVVKRSSDRKGKTHVVIGPDGTKKYFGDPNLGEKGKSKYGKEAFYARHKKNLDNNPYFRAYARKTWEDGGTIPKLNYNNSEINQVTGIPTGKGGLEDASLDVLQLVTTPLALANLYKAGKISYDAYQLAKPNVINLSKTYVPTYRKALLEAGKAISPFEYGGMIPEQGHISMKKRSLKKYGLGGVGEGSSFLMNASGTPSTGGQMANVGVNTALQFLSADGAEAKGEALGSGIGSAAGMALNAVVPGLGFIAGPILGKLGGMAGKAIGDKMDNSEDVAAQQQKQIQANNAMSINANKLAWDGSNQKVTSNSMAFAEGGMVIDEDQMNPTAELELNEQFQLPNGTVGEVDGPSHADGGIETALPEGTRIFSDRLKHNGRTFAKVVKPINSKIAKLEKELEANPNDKLKQNSIMLMNQQLDHYFDVQETNKQNTEMKRSLKYAKGGLVKYDRGGGVPSLVTIDPKTNQPYTQKDIQNYINSTEISQSPFGNNFANNTFQYLPENRFRLVEDKVLNIKPFGQNTSNQYKTPEGQTYISPENLTRADIGAPSFQGYVPKQPSKASNFISNNAGQVGQIGTSLITAGLQNRNVNKLQRPRTLGRVNLSGKITNPNLVDYSAERNAIDQGYLSSADAATRSLANSATAQAFKNQANLARLEGTGRSYQNQENINAQIRNQFLAQRNQAALQEELANNEIAKYNLEGIYGFDQNKLGLKNQMIAQMGNTAGQVFGNMSNYQNQLEQANILANQYDPSVLNDMIKNGKLKVVDGKVVKAAYGGTIGKRSFKNGGINNPGFNALPKKIQENIIANMAMGGEMYSLGGRLMNNPIYAEGGIHIKPENKGKFNATKARTGKTTEELTHSKNPLTRKRAIFAQNAKKWKH